MGRILLLWFVLVNAVVAIYLLKKIWLDYAEKWDNSTKIKYSLLLFVIPMIFGAVLYMMMLFGTEKNNRSGERAP